MLCATDSITASFGGKQSLRNSNLRSKVTDTLLCMLRGMYFARKRPWDGKSHLPVTKCRKIECLVYIERITFKTYLFMVCIRK